MNDKKEIIIVAFLIVFYFITRTVNLNIIPIFTDEAIYSYWAQVALHDPANRFISLEDGKQPLFIWLAAIFQNFVYDPLIANRLVSVLSGLGSLIGIYFLSKSLFNASVAKLASFIYIILPFTVLYDRLGLFDSLLTMLGIWSVFFSIKLARESRFDWAFLAGISIGLAMITKSSGAFFLYLVPFSLILFDLKDKRRNFNLLKWVAFALVTFFIAEVIYNLLRLAPLFYVISRKNLEFIRPVSEVFQNPLFSFSSNSRTLLFWLLEYLSLPLFIVAVASIIYSIVKKSLPAIYLAVLVVLPFLAESIFNKVIYPRFMLFFFPFLIILISSLVIDILEKFPKYKTYLALTFLIFLSIPALNSLRLMTDPPQAKIASGDAGQYLNDWPAGYGVSEVVKVIRENSRDDEIYIGTEGTFGLLPYALNIYFFGENNVHITGFWPVDAQNLPSQIIENAQKNKTYFVFNENQKEIANPSLRLVAKYQKGKGNSFMRLYEVSAQ